MTTTNGPRVPDALINALIAVESGGRDDAIGDGGKAVGCLQIHPILVEDVNRILRAQDRSGTIPPFGTGDRRDRQASIRMCRIYLAHYAHPEVLGREPTLEDMARIWNGGPDGWKEKATEKYWEKVRRQLAPEVFVGPDTLIGGLRVDAPKSAQTVQASAPQAPAPSATAEEREAWDRYVSAAYTVGQRVALAVKTADDLLAERRKRFPVS